jgi:protein involved in polysaccharide export with SLBB domain
MRHLLVLLCLCALSTYAQDFSTLTSLSDLQKKAKSSPLQLPESPEIEHPVDENVYVVGPGDVLTILVGGSEDLGGQIMISPEGHLFMPSTGGIPVAGKTLADAKKKIIDAMKSTVSTDDIQISLFRVRTFKVTVSGAVNYPGLVPVNAQARVSDAISMAGGLVETPPPFPKPVNPLELQRQLPDPEDVELTKDQYEELKENIASKRNIFIKRRNGSTLHADMEKYLIAGDLDANPYLVDGDVIIVPTVQEDVAMVSISGAVRTPGEFEFAKGDKVIDMLNLAHGFAANADSTKIHIARFVDGSDRVENFVYKLDWSDEASVAKVLQMPLQPDDRVFIRNIANFRERHTVEIDGQVVYPGDYALIEQPTYLSQVIEMAGGFTEDAALNAAYVVRRSYQDRKDNEFDRLEYIAVRDMSRRERVYYRERSREIEGLISTDFVKLFKHGDKSYDVKLQDEDLIVVPKKEFSVYVVGHVKNPGLVPFQENQKAKYYINEAGGYNTGAWKRRVRVKKAGTGEMLSVRSTKVEMGDIIVVPEKMEPENLARDVAQITVQLATVVMLVVQTNWYASRN